MKFKASEGFGIAKEAFGKNLYSSACGTFLYFLYLGLRPDRIWGHLTTALWSSSLISV